MARLSDGSDRTCSRVRGSDQCREHRAGTGRRGQMILITGFALAVAFVTLALVLNAVAFTGTLATGEDTAATEALTYRADASAGTKRMLAFVNEHNTSSYSALEETIEADVENVSDLLLRHRVSEGQVVDGRIDTTFDGTWVEQTNSSRNFTNVNGNDTWTLFAGSTGARSFRIHVTDDSHLQPPGATPFNVTARDGASEWRLNVTAESGTATVFVRRADGSELACDASDPSDFWINVSEGTVDGSECDGLGFGEQLNTISSVEYGNAASVDGTYRLMANLSEASVFSTADYATTGSPLTEPAIYGLRLNVTYESDRVEYETDWRVIPGETG